MAKMKCPNCRKGDSFVNKSVFPLKELSYMVDRCAVCNMKMVTETNNGPGINYALTVIIFFLNILWYWPIFGLSYKDNSFYYYMASSTLTVLLLQPWSMRYARVLYLYLLVPYGSKGNVK
ncbi:MAG: hypothetical protein R2800_01955 [Flavipsychrobacter sp.]